MSVRGGLVGHEVVHLSLRVGGIPVHVLRHVFMTIVAALRGPDERIAIVMASVVAIRRRCRESGGPNAGDVEFLFEGAKKSAEVRQSRRVLGLSGESDQFDLDRGKPVGLRIAVMHQRARGNAGVDQLIDSCVIDDEMARVRLV